MEKTETLIQCRGVVVLAAIWIYAEEDPILRLTQSNPKRFRRLSAALNATAQMLVPGPSPGSAANATRNLNVSTNASLPEELLEAVREALGPQEVGLCAYHARSAAWTLLLGVTEAT